MAEFEHKTPVIPQLNFKNISSKRYQILESGSLNYYNRNLQRMLIQEYNLKVTRKQVLSQADHGCGYPRDSNVLKSYQ